MWPVLTPDPSLAHAAQAEGQEHKVALVTLAQLDQTLRAGAAAELPLP